MKKVNLIKNVKFDFLTSNKKYFGFEWWGIAIMVGVFAVELYLGLTEPDRFTASDIVCSFLVWSYVGFTALTNTDN